MPYKIDWEKDGVLVRFWGIFNYQENTGANMEVSGDPRLEDLNYAIWDLSGISDQQMSKAQIEMAAIQDQLISHRLPRLKLALFATEESTRRLCEQYLAQYQTRQTGWQFLMSDDMENIRAWVGS